MRKLVSFSLFLGAVCAASAQPVRPEAIHGAVLGGVAGAVLGNNSGSLHRDAVRGAAIGAGTGFLVGQAVGVAHGRPTLSTHRVHTPGPVRGSYVYRQRPTIHIGIGYGVSHWGHGYPRHHRRHLGYPGYYSYAPSYYSCGYVPLYAAGEYVPATYHGNASAAANGFWLGGIAGGIIGHNSGEFRHNGWRGAAWGAGIGWLLGTIADNSRRSATDQQPLVTSQSVYAPQSAPTPQPVTIISHNTGTPSPMSSANSLFGR